MALPAVWPQNWSVIMPCTGASTLLLADTCVRTTPRHDTKVLARTRFIPFFLYSYGHISAASGSRDPVCRIPVISAPGTAGIRTGTLVADVAIGDSRHNPDMQTANFSRKRLPLCVIVACWMRPCHHSR